MAESHILSGFYIRRFYALGSAARGAFVHFTICYKKKKINTCTCATQAALRCEWILRPVNAAWLFGVCQQKNGSTVPLKRRRAKKKVPPADRDGDAAAPAAVVKEAKQSLEARHLYLLF